MVYPRFAGETFWNFAAACEIFGARYPTSPLGLITVAAMLPASWNLRLLDRNVEELSESDIASADLVMTGGMLPQHDDLLEIIELCRKLGTPVAIGGPAATSVPHFYAKADFQVLGEVEDVIGEFIAAWDSGVRSGVFTAKKFEIDVRKTPIPRFDLLKFDRYLYVGVQFTRGCPFTCEFCDIIELYGRVPRTKSTPQMLAELDALYALGYRGHVDFVDDNLIGNKKAVKAFLPDLKAWLEAHDYPFEFTTEASLNLADDEELLRLMNEANFVGVFVGIESPDPETLVQMRKKQNTRRSIPDSVHRIYGAGMFVTAGFIVGFDNEKSGMADAMAELIEEAAIPVCMVGLLYALPNTQLTRRLTKEGRLHPPPEFASSRADQCTLGLNYDTLRPRKEILTDYRDILQKAYEPAAFASRLSQLAKLLDNSTRKRQVTSGDARRGFQSKVQQILGSLPEPDLFKKILVQCATANPNSLRTIVTLMAFYLHLGPFSRHVISQIDVRIAELEDEPHASSAMLAQPMARIEAAE
ncbi:MAG: B12-binding domain-containing radical SAM protein [Pseudorhodoplanes sp.]